MNYIYKKLLAHRGHHIVCVSYGDWNDPADVCIECEDCNEVLISAEDFDVAPSAHPFTTYDELLPNELCDNIRP